MKKTFLMVIALLALSVSANAIDKPQKSTINNPNFVNPALFDGRLYITKDLVLEDTLTGGLITNRIYLRDSLFVAGKISGNTIDVRTSLNILAGTISTAYGDITFDVGSVTFDNGLESNGDAGFTQDVDVTGDLKLNGTAGTLYPAVLTNSQRNALTVSNGAVIYNDDIDRFQVYENGDWTTLHTDGQDAEIDALTYTSAISAPVAFTTEMDCSTGTIFTQTLSAGQITDILNIADGQTVTAVVVTNSEEIVFGHTTLTLILIGDAPTAGTLTNIYTFMRVGSKIFYRVAQVSE